MTLCDDKPKPITVIGKGHFHPALNPFHQQILEGSQKVDNDARFLKGRTGDFKQVYQETIAGLPHMIT